jgi:hypothetical protein
MVNMLLAGSKSFSKEEQPIRRNNYLELTNNFCLTLVRYFIKICFRKKAAKAGIEPARFSVEVEDLTNYTMEASLQLCDRAPNE